MVDTRSKEPRARTPPESEPDGSAGGSAEEFFRAGLILLKRRQVKDALKAFGRALDLEPSEPRYRSFYGRCLAVSGGDVRKALQLCKSAVDQEFYRADLHLNLGKALLAAGKRREAVEAFRDGLSLDQQNREILRELEEMGTRRRPLLPFLDRKNPVNKLLGLVRHRLRSRTPNAAPAPGRSRS